MSARDGGPAFPQTWRNDSDRNVEGPSGEIVPPGFNVCILGMSLRDFFAAKAMQALLNPNGEPLDRLAEVPGYAYQIADAMLKAREAKP